VEAGDQGLDGEASIKVVVPPRRTAAGTRASGLSHQATMQRRQIESARIALTRHIKRGGKVWIRIFPDKPITSKPAETRMGKGKGNPEGWVAVVTPGRIMFELEGVDEKTAKRAMELAAAKLPIKCKFIVRDRQL